MSNENSNVVEARGEGQVREIQESLKKLERRDWWLWIVAVAVMLLLTLAIFSLSFPGLVQFGDLNFQLNVGAAARGLMGLVVLFNSYAIYQQTQIKKLRRQLSGQLDSMNRLVIRSEELEKQATIDPLTGLYNRRFADGRLAAEAARSQRYGHPLTVVSFDLDKFKEINDVFGHAAGDEALVEFGRRLTRAIRMSDVGVRMGGDEFLAILPECPPEKIANFLARLRAIAISHDGREIPVKFSAGWVAYEAGETPEHFLKRADEMLYTAKRSGREAEEQAPQKESATQAQG